MSWFDRHKWSRHRAEEERKALAASVEELAAHENAQLDGLSEGDGEMKGTSGPAFIPPKLRLQSRPLPAVRLDAIRHAATESEQVRGEQAAVMPPMREPGKRLGRSTKIRLQAVRPGQEPTTERVTALDMLESQETAQETSTANERQPIVRRLEATSVATSSLSAPKSLLCGSGIIEAGQEDATIYNARISAQSVVSVMLAGNPGPVVVHYVSLQPRAGFTLHMSAPVTTTTPFTYAVWLF